jgi:hypothetical protein
MKSWVLFAGFALGAGLAHAGEITFSNSSTTTNSTSGATEQYTSGQINGSWDPTLFSGSSSDWISFDSADLFGCSAAHNQTVNKGTAASFCAVPLNDTVTFTDTFTLSSISGTYTLWFLVDDSATVKVDSNTLALAGTVDCTSSGECTTPVQINVPAADLHTGSNTLTFQVVQLLDDSEFGLNFDLVQTPAASAPEPGSLFLLGSGLLGAGLIGRFRRRKS